MTDTFREEMMIKIFLLRKAFAWGPLKENRKTKQKKSNLEEENNYFGWKESPHYTGKDN